MAERSLRAKRWLRYGWRVASAILSLAIAVALVLWSLKGLDVAAVWTHMGRLAPEWFYLALLCSLVAFYLRALRWNLLLQVGHAPLSQALLFWTLMASYLVNYALPRIGEAYRCGALKRKANRAASQVLGTVLLERIVDLLCMAVAFGIALALAPTAMHTLWKRLWQPIPQQLPFLGLSLIGLLIIALGFFWWLKKNHPLKPPSQLKKRLRHLLSHTKKGLLSLRDTPHPVRFVFFTLAMWMLYFLNTYCIFQCLPESKSLLAADAWVVMVAGGIGMTAPVQGGIGTFHVMVAATLIWFGIPKVIAAALTSVIYGSYALLTIGLGAVGLFYVATLVKKPSPQQSSTAQKSDDGRA